MDKFVLGIIPARGGSKGIPKKNITLVCGIPLIGYTIKAASQSRLLSDTIVSTDSIEIRDAALRLGAKVPFMRPPELSDDHSPTIKTVSHAVKMYEELYNKTVDIIALLQPTTPLRTAADIDQSIKLLLDNPLSNSLISCYLNQRVHPRIMYTINNGICTPLLNNNTLGIRRQEFEDIYVRNGAVYLTKRQLLNENKLVDDYPLCYIMPEERSVNIDTEYDLKLVEYFFKGSALKNPAKGLVPLNP
ncbi:MAG: acylneuraminate cytidylyltransferase family protein, partial [Nitrospirae bacterium]|nr:acylneuraminate cytidylyltransferase family protein [Nitrospirota bacterium]